MEKQDIIKILNTDLGYKQQYMKDAINAVKRGDYKIVNNNLYTNLKDKIIPLVFYDIDINK